MNYIKSPLTSTLLRLPFYFILAVMLIGIYDMGFVQSWENLIESGYRTIIGYTLFLLSSLVVVSYDLLIKLLMLTLRLIILLQDSSLNSLKERYPRIKKEGKFRKSDKILLNLHKKLESFLLAILTFVKKKFNLEEGEKEKEDITIERIN